MRGVWPAFIRRNLRTIWTGALGCTLFAIGIAAILGLSLIPAVIAAALCGYGGGRLLRLAADEYTPLNRISPLASAYGR